jgi:hypothetical protein
MVVLSNIGRLRPSVCRGAPAGSASQMRDVGTRIGSLAERGERSGGAEINPTINARGALIMGHPLCGESGGSGWVG